jgi:hypothetical protein
MRSLAPERGRKKLPQPLRPHGFCHNHKRAAARFTTNSASAFPQGKVDFYESDSGGPPYAPIRGLVPVPTHLPTAYAVGSHGLRRGLIA